jgi:hypothetical protein
VSVCSQGLTCTQNMNWGFFLSTTLPTNGLLLIPITYICRFRVLCPVRRPMTILDCVLLKDSNHALVAKSGPEINSQACLCVLQGPYHIAKCWLSIQHLIFLLMFCLETRKKGFVPTNFWTEPSLASLSAISFPRNLACPGTQYSPTVCRVEMSFNAFWHCLTRGDVVLAAWSAFRATWLSEHMLTYFSGLSWVPISWTQANIAYTSAWKTVACFPREIQSLLSTDCPQTPAQVPYAVLDPSVNQTSPLTAGFVDGYRHTWATCCPHLQRRKLSGRWDQGCVWSRKNQWPCKGQVFRRN